MKDGDMKSQENIMLNLYKAMLNDLGKQHQISDFEIARDVEVVVSRTRAEGLSFLTKTLPKLGKALDKALLAEEFTPMSEFSHDRGTAYPRLFRRLTELIFEREGMLKAEPDVTAIQSLRQLAYLFYKYDLPYQDLTVRLSMEEFIDVDQSIAPVGSDVDTIATIYHGQEVLNEVFSTFDLTFREVGLRPKNGPGAVAHGEEPWQRYEPHRRYTSLDELIPYESFFPYSDRHLFDHWDRYWDLPYRESAGTAVLLAVPKDSRGPRLISKEPQEYMAYQQALKRLLYDHIESHPITAGQVNFTDRTVNGNLALRASKDASLATLDLSAASDRLSLGLVKALFEDLPRLREYLLSTRTAKTRLPNDHIIFTRKYAPMGSALTFPVQSIVFYALLVGDLVRGGMPFSEAARSVWVYGDDIIVPTYYAPEAMAVLERVGLKVNTDKSCYSGHFRESCGVDAFSGVDVTPVKIKEVWRPAPRRKKRKGKRPAKKSNVKGIKPEITTIQAWVDYADGLFWRGYWETASHICDMLKRAMGKKIMPCVSLDSPIIGMLAYSKEEAKASNKSTQTWSSDLQCHMYKGLAARSTGFMALKKHEGWLRLSNWAWNNIRDHEEEKAIDAQPYATGLFTRRHRVRKKHVLVAESQL
jgi:hypothetical protein